MLGLLNLKFIIFVQVMHEKRGVLIASKTARISFARLG